MQANSEAVVSWTTWLPVVLSGLSAVVAIAAGWIAYIAPRSAAQLAESLRSNNQAAETRVNLKRYVFVALMQERAAPYTLEAVRMFNAIDVVFHDNVLLREAWAQYHKSQDIANDTPVSLRTQYLSHLLKLMAEDIGMGDIRSSDLDRFYQPTFLARKLSIESMQGVLQEKELERLLSENQKSAVGPPKGK